MRKFSETLRIHPWTLHKVMKNLQNKKLVIASKQPHLFWAKPFEKVLNTLIKERIEKQKSSKKIGKIFSQSGKLC